MLLRSHIVSGLFTLGIMVTYSSFQQLGQCLEPVMVLYMLVSEIARKSASCVINWGKMSPLTINFGFWKFQIRAATSYPCKASSPSSKVMGTWPSSRVSNSCEILLNYPASISPAFWLVLASGSRSLTPKCLGLSSLLKFLTCQKKFLFASSTRRYSLCGKITPLAFKDDFVGLLLLCIIPGICPDSTLFHT